MKIDTVAEKNVKGGFPQSREVKENLFKNRMHVYLQKEIYVIWKWEMVIALNHDCIVKTYLF